MFKIRGNYKLRIVIVIYITFHSYIKYFCIRHNILV